MQQDHQLPLLKVVGVWDKVQQDQLNNLSFIQHKLHLQQMELLIKHNKIHNIMEWDKLMQILKNTTQTNLYYE